jgi:hypothetical protein
MRLPRSGGRSEAINDDEHVEKTRGVEMDGNGELANMSIG